MTASTLTTWPTMDVAGVRSALLGGHEIALIDVREEEPYAQGHPLWAANLPLSTLELKAWQRIPRRDTAIVLYGDQVDPHAPHSQDMAACAAVRLHALGYTHIHLLAGGLAAWSAAGGELFIDVNVPSKAFGELVESTCHTPSLSAQEVQSLLAQESDTVVLDARRYEEYQTMSIPGSISVPGAELVLQARALAPKPTTRIIVNCAGRTRSIIGTQSLRNAGLPNPIVALRNGTIGWLLAQQQLEHGACRRPAPQLDPERVAQAQLDARQVALRAGVQHTPWSARHTLTQAGRTVYHYDVRTPQEYAQGHLAGFGNAPGGQLVQETDHYAPVRGARIVLTDPLLVRADMTASWLAQMGWECHVLDQVPETAYTQTGTSPTHSPQHPPSDLISAAELASLLKPAADAENGVVVLDFSPSAQYQQGHIPGAWYVLRSHLKQALARIPAASRYVLTCSTSELAFWAAQDMRTLLPMHGHSEGGTIQVLAAGTLGWTAQGLPLEQGPTRLASPAIDRYQRPYEGTRASPATMQAYLDWEYGLVEQLQRDATHGFRII